MIGLGKVSCVNVAGGKRRMPGMNGNGNGNGGWKMPSLETEMRHLEGRLDEIQQQLIRIEMRMIRAGQ